jgi:hypothetical protein
MILGATLSVEPSDSNCLLDGKHYYHEIARRDDFNGFYFVVKWRSSSCRRSVDMPTHFTGNNAGRVK